MKQSVHIDEILGLGNKRYFGAGYKQVKHDLCNIHIDPQSNSFSAEISIYYPSNWSNKETAKELKPHLSTIDAYIISSQLVEAYINYCQLLSGSEVKNSWIRKLSIKAGKSSVNDLKNIPLEGQYKNTIPSINSLNGNISTFSIFLAGFSISLELDHSPMKEINNLSTGYFYSIDDIIDFRKTSYYGGQYKNLRHEIMINESNSELLRADIGIIKEPAYLAHDNLGSKYALYYNPLDILISCAQLCQVLMYKIDNLDRSNTKNLWMRSITVNCPKPLLKEGTLPITVRIDKSRKFNKAGSEWRTAELSGMTYLDNKCYLEASVAHEVLAVKTAEPA